jgi:hypothetical protein
MHTHNPRYPVHALTTYELRRYRRALEHSLKGIPAEAPVRERLCTRLAEVVAEEKCRSQPDSGPRAAGVRTTGAHLAR